MRRTDGFRRTPPGGPLRLRPLVLLAVSLASCGYSWTEFFHAASPFDGSEISVSVGHRWYMIYEKIVLKISLHSPTTGSADLFIGADEQNNVPSHPCSPDRLGILWLEEPRIVAIRMDCELGEDFDRVFDLDRWKLIRESGAIESLRLDRPDLPWQWEELQLPPR